MKNAMCDYRESYVDAWNALMFGNVLFKNRTPPTLKGRILLIL